MGNPVKQGEAHPIANLLGEVEMLEVEINGYIVPISDEYKAHLKEMLMSAYATGFVKGKGSK